VKERINLLDPENETISSNWKELLIDSFKVFGKLMFYFLILGFSYFIIGFPLNKDEFIDILPSIITITSVLLVFLQR
jgi:hypothetical protein